MRHFHCSQLLPVQCTESVSDNFVRPCFEQLEILGILTDLHPVLS